jgi:hypothetical protein
MSGHEWSPEDLRALVELLRGIHDDATIAELEVSLASSPHATPTPMPDTAHPAYESKARGVRALMDGRRAILVPRGVRASAAFVSEGEAFPPAVAELRTNMLTVRRCVGLAPFVGDPRVHDARYVWQVAIDDAGRWVADSARLAWRHR